MVSRYSCSATVAWPSTLMRSILLQRLHALRRQLHERARGRREVRVAARDEGERVEDRGIEADVVQPAGEAAAERHAARADRVAEPAQRQVQRSLDVLDLDLRLDRHARP